MELGKINQLYVSRSSDPGLYLVDADENEVLLPNAYVTPEIQIDDVIEVFVYRDSEERLVATTLIPKVQAEQFGYLEVFSQSDKGTFLDWGIPKQLFVPFAEQMVKMEEGQSYVVYVFVDERSDRLMASARIEDFLFYEEIELNVGDKVSVLPYRKSELGINVVVNDLYQGLIFNNAIHKDIRFGELLEAYVKLIREDGKIDITLVPQGYKQSKDLVNSTILEKIREAGGVLAITDKSSPEEIKSMFGLSKKAFKRGLGNLWKEGVVELHKDKIVLKK